MNVKPGHSVTVAATTDTIVVNGETITVVPFVTYVITAR